MQAFDLMSSPDPLPHHKLVAYQVAREMLMVVLGAQIKDARLRDQALRAAKSACLNIAEAAGRTGTQDRARVFAIARGEVCEAAAAIEIASLASDCDVSVSDAVVKLADRLVGLLTGLIRH